MTIEFPSRDNLKQSAKADIRSELEGSNPFLRVSWIGSIATSWAFRLFDFYEKLKELLTQVFWDTAELPFLSRWASIFKITVLPATQATGNVVAQGLVGAPIPISTTLSISGIQYLTTLAGAIALESLSVTSLIRSGATVTITTLTPHSWATGTNVTVLGAVEVEYNGAFPITVTGTNTGTYQITDTPTSPATGTILADAAIAVLPVKADTGFFGVQTNQDSGAAIAFITPVPNVNNDTFVSTDGLTGGNDQETTEDNRVRFLNRVQNPVANFNVAAITQAVLGITGNTRVFVNEATPVEGKVTTFFTRDNDGIIPNSADVTRTKDAVELIRPANTATVDNIVLAPTPIVIPFDFSTLSPNTVTMQNAVNNSLDVFFQERTEVSKDITVNEYTAAIQNTVDIDTGTLLVDFVLTSPTLDISIPLGGIGFKGAVTFP